VRRSLFVLVLTGLVAASCSGGAPERDYDIAVRNAYLENCQYEGGDPSSCAVTLDCIEEQLTQDEFKYEENWVSLRGEFSDVMTGVLATCMARVSVAAPSTTSLPPSTSAAAPSTTSRPPSTSAAAPAAEGKIAFHSDRDGDWEIFVMNADGTGVTQLTDNDDWDSDPDWSPDGNKIAFQSDRDGAGEIFVMNADGTGVQQLTDNDDLDWVPAWSPDGNKIAFNSDRDGDSEIFVMNADGTGVTQLTNNERRWDGLPDWSPDGNKIAFYSDRDGDSEIFVMNADGTGVTQLTNNEGRWDGLPDWSPDGNKIVFSRNPLDAVSLGEIFVMNADGTGVTQLTNNRSPDLYPVWSPDGNKIAFQNDLYNSTAKVGATKILVMDADGSNVVSLDQQGAPSSWGGGKEFAPAATTTYVPVSDLLEQTGQHQLFLLRDADGSEVRLFREISSCIPTGRVNDATGWFYYRVDGSITNIGNDTYYGVYIRLYFIDESGNYLGLSYVNGPTDHADGGFALGPGETKQFDQEVLLLGDVPFFTRVTCNLQDFEWR
jgi:dipeptidyl aminopeptidase/acylaminoacyl peptidase